MPYSQQQNAPSLTVDLWAKVFAHLKDILEDEYECLPHHSQVMMHQLKLVCKQFRQTFTSHSGLVRKKFLGSSFSERQLPSLLAWLQKSQGSVRAVMSICNAPLLEVVLAQLQSSQLSIEWMDVYGVSPSLLTAFSSLERCALKNTKASDLDLEPLSCLAKLNHLSLRGQFRKLYHVTGLTRLECASNYPESEGIISDVREFATTLQHLKVDGCALLGVHTLGLSACTALTQLVLRNPCLMFVNTEFYIDRELSLYPNNLGLLGQLHTLHLRTSEEGISSLSWISVLRSLQHLTICIRGCTTLRLCLRHG